MRMLVVTLAMAAGLAACGPSDRDVALAKTTKYHGDAIVLFGEMRSVVEEKYKLDRADETKLIIQTIPRWYNPEGQGISASGPDDPLNMPDRSIKLALTAELLAVEGDWVVQVRPLMIRYRAGQSAPDPLREGDPSLPGWVPGKVDQLQYAIYESLKKYEVKTGGIPQAPTGPEPTDPDEPGPGGTDPSAGSAEAPPPAALAPTSATTPPPAAPAAPTTP